MGCQRGRPIPIVAERVSPGQFWASQERAIFQQSTPNVRIAAARSDGGVAGLDREAQFTASVLMRLSGRAGLPRACREVLVLAALNLSNDDIAALRGRDIETVKVQMRTVLRQLAIPSRGVLVFAAERARGLFADGRSDNEVLTFLLIFFGLLRLPPAPRAINPRRR